MPTSAHQEARELRAKLKLKAANLRSFKVVMATPGVEAQVIIDPHEAQPYVMGTQAGLTRQIHMCAEATGISVVVTQSGWTGEHAHEGTRYESIIWLGGEGKLRYKPIGSNFYVTIDLKPGDVIKHRADMPHDFYGEKGARFIVAFTPPLPTDPIVADINHSV